MKPVRGKTRLGSPRNQWCCSELCPAGTARLGPLDKHICSSLTHSPQRLAWRDRQGVLWTEPHSSELLGEGCAGKTPGQQWPLLPGAARKDLTSPPSMTQSPCWVSPRGWPSKGFGRNSSSGFTGEQVPTHLG